ncbi:hypothetical protein HMPREF1549_02078 [Actinomyces johnsonii F0510]|uniref:Uncharacterized protein n=1 Tax=Actinomyces johnsonii F0510 TaxID=1227262 RepID=U1PPK4_9ACTO|nr:hypothetical protein HMPREF1549_02078 [Actinomyces johnsonii F0510]
MADSLTGAHSARNVSLSHTAAVAHGDEITDQRMVGSDQAARMLVSRGVWVLAEKLVDVHVSHRLVGYIGSDILVSASILRGAHRCISHHLIHGVCAQDSKRL